MEARIVHFGARCRIWRINSLNVRCEGSLRSASKPSITTTGSWESDDTKERTSLLRPSATLNCSRDSTEKSSATKAKHGRFSALHWRTNCAIVQLFPLPGEPVIRTELVRLMSQICDRSGLRDILTIVPSRTDPPS